MSSPVLVLRGSVCSEVFGELPTEESRGFTDTSAKAVSQACFVRDQHSLGLQNFFACNNIATLTTFPHIHAECNQFRHVKNHFQEDEAGTRKVVHSEMPSGKDGT